MENRLTEKSSQPAHLKPSRYNHFFRLDNDNMLAYNAFSNSLARLTIENFKIVEKILITPNSIEINDTLWMKLKNDLIKGGFLVDLMIDEFEVLRAQSRIGRFANRKLNLTIAPTLRCNFRCIYCFEEQKIDSMTPAVEEALIKFVANKTRDLKSLGITWFGGEPLLKLDIIERITEKLSKLCAENKTDFEHSSIITNGYLLSRETAFRLKKSNISLVQVTLDGPLEIHDQRRKLANGKGTFQKILENIKNSANILKIFVRINIDKSNADYLHTFYDLWEREGLIDKVGFYFGQVRSDTEACADIASSCFTTLDYSQMAIELTKQAKQKNLSIARYPSLHKAGYCGADNLNSFVVSPSGFLFKCWEEIAAGEKYSIGNILASEETPAQIMQNARYINWDVFSNEDCQVCNIFPVCSGGCVHSAMKATERKECNFWKFCIEDMLILKYSELNKPKK